MINKLWCIFIIIIILILILLLNFYNEKKSYQKGGGDINVLNSIKKDIENARKERAKIQDELSKINIEIKLTNKKPITNNTIKELNELYIKTDILLDKENKTINILEKAVKKITDIEKKLLKKNYKKTKGGFANEAKNYLSNGPQTNNGQAQTKKTVTIQGQSNNECDDICGINDLELIRKK